MSDEKRYFIWTNIRVLLFFAIGIIGSKVLS